MKLLVSLLLAFSLFSCSNQKKPETTTGEYEEFPGIYNKVPITYTARRVIFEAVISDSVKANLIFDSGADNLYFDTLFYKRSPLKYNNLVSARIGGNGENLQKIEVIFDTVNFSIGDHILSDQRVPIRDLKSISGTVPST